MSSLSSGELELLQLALIFATVIGGLLIIKEVGKRPSRKQIATLAFLFLTCATTLGALLWSIQVLGEQKREDHRETLEVLVDAEERYHRQTGAFTDSAVELAEQSLELRRIVRQRDITASGCYTFCLQVSMDRQSAVIVVSDENGEYVEVARLNRRQADD